MLAGDARYRIDGAAGESLASSCSGAAPAAAIRRSSAWRSSASTGRRDDPRWFAMLEQPLRDVDARLGRDGWDADTYLTCFRLLLERCDPNLRGRPTDGGQFGLTTLHNIVGARRHVAGASGSPSPTAILDRGARLDMRDHLLKSTPLGWACRWGQLPLVDAVPRARRRPD